jgi:CRP-like cAMP-binding protein
LPSLTQVNRASSSASVLRQLLERAAGGPLPAWEQVERVYQVRHVPRGSTVFRQGVVHPFVYAVRAGVLKLYYVGEDGSEWIKSFAEEGHFFASIAALETDGRTSFAVSALEPSTVECVDYRQLERLAAEHLVWSRALRMLTMVFAARKEQRERELLTLRPEARYLAFSRANPELVRRVPQKELARHLGLTAVGLSRIAVRLRRGE